MRRPSTLIPIALLAATAACTPNIEPIDEAALARRGPSAAQLRMPGERRLRNIQQLTFGGENAEAYFNADGTELVFQATRDGFGCDQIFRMDADGRNLHLVSTGEGRTTCSFISPTQPRIIYSSTHAALKTCPERPDYSRGYVWRLQPELDIYTAGPDGQDPTPLAPHPGYDAEGVFSPQGDRILFTSTRGGDVDIYSMRADGTDVKRLTDEVGYDGGAFYSLDGEKIVYRAHHPTTPEAREAYKALLADDLVRPSVMELFVMDADGGNKRQITRNGAANFAPYFHPDGERIIFSSNLDDPRGRDFDLYMIGADGKGLERVTFNPSFDSFPMFSYDGAKIVFASNRNASKPGETNVFIADWVDDRELEPPQAARLRGQAELDTQTFSGRVARLSSEKMQGRGLGSPGLEEAARYLGEQFALVGLKPAPGAEDFRQTFEVPVSTEVEEAKLIVGGVELARGEAFTPMAFSSSGEVTAEAIFVGYGISAPEFDHDDYEGVDVEGKVAVVLRGEPYHPESNAEAFDGPAPSRHTDLVTKALTAREHGARAVLIVNDPRTYLERKERPDALYALDEASSSASILVAHLTASGAGAALPMEELARLQRELDAGGVTRSGKSLGEVSLAVKISQKQTQTANLVGRLPAREDGAPTERALIIGAHYDHLGMGGSSSMRPDVRAIHPGADDNASGVALMLELAEALAVVPRRHDVYFVAFSAEESGLLGSEHFARHSPIPLDRAIAMLNFDMVGRMKDQRAYVSGVGTARELLDLVRRHQIGSGLDLSLSFEGYGPSDHLAFHVREVPVLHFFTGTHNEYHTPEDTAEKLNAGGAMQLAAFVFGMARELASSDRLPTHVATRDTRQGDHGGIDRRGYGPYFGSIPGFGQEGEAEGALLMGARPGSPAEKAGVQKGDVLVQFGETEVKTLRDFAFALRKHSPGDVVKLVVLRDGERVTLEATLTARPGEGDAKSPHREGTPHSDDTPHE